MYTMTIDGLTFYDPTLTEYGLKSPQLNQSANKIGSLSFTIYPENPRYDSIVMRKSLIRVYRDGALMTIMRPIRKRKLMTGGVEYTCEELTGALNDILKRPEAEASTKTAREYIRDNLVEASTIAAGSDIFIPAADYFRSIMRYNEGTGRYAFRYLTASSYLWPSPASYNEGGVNHYFANKSNANKELQQALAALGYNGPGYMPPVTGDELLLFPYQAVIDYGAAKGLTSAAYRTFCNLVYVYDAADLADRQYDNNWQRVGSALYQTLVDEMNDFLNNLPEDADWDTQVTGFPITFSVGNTPASGDSYEYQNTEYVGYWDYLQRLIVDENDGYLIPAWTESGCTINYMTALDLPQSSQSIVFGENMADLFVETDLTEQYTTIIPLGAEGLTIKEYNHGADHLADEASYALYGRKEIVKEWPDITDAYTLYSTAVQWLIDNSLLMKDCISVTAYDLKYAGVDTEYLTFMEQITVRSELHGVEESYPITEASISLDSPDANTYQLGNEPESLVDEINDK